MDKWISVEDMLPGFKNPYVVGKAVLVYCQKQALLENIGVGKYYHDSRGWIVDGRSPGVEVTHWMPLPDPPTDGGE